MTVMTDNKTPEQISNISSVSSTPSTESNRVEANPELQAKMVQQEASVMNYLRNKPLRDLEYRPTPEQVALHVENLKKTLSQVQQKVARSQGSAEQSLSEVQENAWALEYKDAQWIDNATIQKVAEGFARMVNTYGWSHELFIRNFQTEFDTWTTPDTTLFFVQKEESSAPEEKRISAVGGKDSTNLHFMSWKNQPYMYMVGDRKNEKEFISGIIHELSHMAVPGTTCNSWEEGTLSILSAAARPDDNIDAGGKVEAGGASGYINAALLSYLMGLDEMSFRDTAGFEDVNTRLFCGASVNNETLYERANAFIKRWNIDDEKDVKRVKEILVTPKMGGWMNSQISSRDVKELVSILATHGHDWYEVLLTTNTRVGGPPTVGLLNKWLQYSNIPLTEEIQKQTIRER